MNAVTKFQLFHKLLEARLTKSFDILCENLADHNGLGSFEGLPPSQKDAILECVAKMCVQFDDATKLRAAHGGEADRIFDVVEQLHSTARLIAQVEDALQAASAELEPAEG